MALQGPSPSSCYRTHTQFRAVDSFVVPERSPWQPTPEVNPTLSPPARQDEPHYTDISKRTAVAVITPGGLLIKRHLPDAPPTHSPTATNKRGGIFGITMRSRRRQFAQMAAINYREFCDGQGKRSQKVQGIFITLTYPDEFPIDFVVYKRHLANFRKRLVRKFGASGAWVAEYQDRGAVHYHLVCNLTRKVSKFWLRKWIARAWYEIVGSGDERHLRAGTSCDAIRTQDLARLSMYVSGYMCKNGQSMAPLDESGNKIQTGKMWNFFGELPTATRSIALMGGYECWQELIVRIRHNNPKSHFLRTLSPKQPGFRLIGDGEALYKQYLARIPQIALDTVHTQLVFAEWCRQLEAA